MNLHDIIGLRRPPTLAAIPTTDRVPSAARPVASRASRAHQDALEILAEQMHDAISRRRMSDPGTDSFRLADERVAYLIELSRGLQRETAILDEIWRLPLEPLG
jgi:hypothetical protein